MTIFGRQPVVWIGLLASLVMLLLQAAQGAPIVVDGQPAQTLANAIKIFGPIIAAFISQNFVTPTSSPILPAGTPVTTPAGESGIVATASTPITFTATTAPTPPTRPDPTQ